MVETANGGGGRGEIHDKTQTSSMKPHSNANDQEENHRHSQHDADNERHLKQRFLPAGVTAVGTVPGVVCSGV